VKAATSSADLIQLVDSLPGKRVLVVGDVMLDRYLWGRVDRISPEAPVPVVEVERETFCLGGAANVAHNITALGGRPVLVSVIGEDTSGDRFMTELKRRGMDIAELVVDEDRRTTVKTRIIAHQQQVVRADEEDLEDVAGAALQRVLDAIERLTPEVDAVLISDYGKGLIQPELLRPTLVRAKENNLSVSVDPKENHFPSYKGATVISPNQAEAGFAYGKRITDEASLLEVGHGLRERLDTDCVLLTRGADGMSLFGRDGSHTHLPTVAREIYDVTGAGDTVVGVFSLALAAGADFVTAARLANHAAGAVIRHTGTAVVGPEELKGSLGGSEPD
jgi:D-beta-D-heptose 7-phosphate kinase/D-beta-D-heptose 1-phosphate adenosyltransferase